MSETAHNANPELELAETIRELSRARRMLQDAQRLAKVGNWERDLNTGETIWSDEMFRIHGYEPGEFTPTLQLAEAFAHPEDRHLRREYLARAEAMQGTECAETFRLQLPCGEERVVRSLTAMVPDPDPRVRRMIGTVQDITEEVRSREAEAQLAQIVLSTNEAILTVGLDLKIRSWNPAAERLYGYTAEEVIGRTADFMLPKNMTPEQRAKRAARQRRVLADEGSVQFEERRVRKDGTLVDVQVVVSALRDGDGRVTGIMTSARDITDRRRAEERMAQLVNHDALTGLFNRHRFEERLTAAIGFAEQEKFEGAVLMLDLDNFKYVNETHGHNTGDAFLVEIADVLRGQLRDTDALARFGGDEFCVLRTPCDSEQALRWADELLDAVRNHTTMIDGVPLRATASVGVAIFGGQTGATAAELLADVDRAMYESKESGRDRATVYSDAERVDGRRRLRSAGEHMIRDALAHDHFELYAQPIVDLTTGQMDHVEVLLRMQRDGRIVSPGEFLPAAERLGLIHLIDYWVIEHAMRAAAQHPDLTFEVNLSGSTIDDERLEGFIANELRKSGADPCRIVFELTETAAVGNIGRARELARRLSDLGCRFAIDDFGSGFSTFYYLKHFPADYVKIDGEFISDPRSRMDELVIDSIVRIARDLGKQTIAEYVADQAALDRVRRLGVDYGQGYHFAKPFPVAELATWPRQMLDPETGTPLRSDWLLAASTALD